MGVYIFKNLRKIIFRRSVGWGDEKLDMKRQTFLVLFHTFYSKNLLFSPVQQTKSTLF